MLGTQVLENETLPFVFLKKFITIFLLKYS